MSDQQREDQAAGINRGGGGRPMIEPGRWYQVETPGMDAVRGKMVDVDLGAGGEPAVLWLQREGSEGPMAIGMGPGMRVSPIADPTPAPERRVRRAEGDAEIPARRPGGEG